MADAAPVIAIVPLMDFPSLAESWLELERRADCSFFQSWAWTGCLADERFAEPWLLSARRGDDLVALGLFNRGPRPRWRLGRPLLLGETGEAACDSIFIEHNGLLLDAAESHDLARSCWAALAAHAQLGRTRWMLSGVPADIPASLPPGRLPRILARRPAPYLDFARFAAEASLLDQLSANARQQLRRSLRAWEKIGPLALDWARDADEAGGFLTNLKALHQTYWTGRGKPGAFAEPFFERFHRALIARVSSGQSADLIRIRAGERTVGYLYNLVHGGWVAAYQSGFDFGPDADELRPGLICHLLAIGHYRAAGMRIYDFLAGEARYKRSLANAESELLWLQANRQRWIRPRHPSDPA